MLQLTSNFTLCVLDSLSSHCTATVDPVEKTECFLVSFSLAYLMGLKGFIMCIVAVNIYRLSIYLG